MKKAKPDVGQTSASKDIEMHAVPADAVPTHAPVAGPRIFFKPFTLANGEQLLVMRKYEPADEKTDPYKVEIHADFDSVHIQMTAGFKSKKKMDGMFDAFDLEQAEKIWKDLNEQWISADENEGEEEHE